MVIEKKLKQNIIFNSIYQTLVIFIPIITMPYLTRVFSTEQLGINGYTLSLTQIFIILSFFGINTYGSREIASINDFTERSKKFWEIWSIQLVFTLISFIIFSLLNKMIFNKYNIFFFIQSFSIITNGLEISWFFVGLENLKSVVLRNTFIKIIMTCVIFLVIRDENDFILYLILNIISVLLGNLIMFINLFSYIKFINIKVLDIIKHLPKAFLFLIPQISILIYTNLDKTILGTLSSMQDVAFYDQSQKIVRMIIALVSSIGTAMLPTMTICIKENNMDKFHLLLDKAFQSICILSIYIVTMIICISSSFVYWFFGSEYTPVIKLMKICSIIALFIPISSLLWNALLIPMKKDTIAIKSAIYAAIISLTLNLILVPKLGALGAVIALCSTELFCMVYRIYYSNKYYNFKKYSMLIIKLLLISILVIILVNLLTSKLATTMLTTIVQGIIATIVYFFLLIFSGIINIKNIINLNVLLN